VHRKDFRKLHIVAETVQPEKIIHASALTAGNCGDPQMLIPLLEGIDGPIGEVSGDKGYPSRRNAQYIRDRGAKPYLMPKENARPRSNGFPAWREMVLERIEKPSLFEKHYHRRSNNESVNSTWKRWFGDSLRSRKRWNQRRETTWKKAVYNLRHLIRFRLRTRIAGGI
jgi:transposase